jgi:hypothetical protein
MERRRSDWQAAAAAVVLNEAWFDQLEHDLDDRGRRQLERVVRVHGSLVDHDHARHLRAPLAGIDRGGDQLLDAYLDRSSGTGAGTGNPLHKGDCP